MNLPNPYVYQALRKDNHPHKAALRWARLSWHRWHAGAVGSTAGVCAECGAACPDPTARQSHALHHADIAALERDLDQLRGQLAEVRGWMTAGATAPVRTATVVAEGYEADRSASIERGYEHASIGADQDFS